jgi:phage-related protein
MAAVAVTLVGGGIGLLIRIGIAVILRRGYGPARIFLTVVSVYSLGITALHGFDPISVVQVVLVVIPVILVWLPASHRYFRTVGEARRQAKASGMTVGFLG